MFAPRGCETGPRPRPLCARTPAPGRRGAPSRACRSWPLPSWWSRPSCIKPLPPPLAPDRTSTIPLTLPDGRTVDVVNLSDATASNADRLVQLANNSTVSQDAGSSICPALRHGDWRLRRWRRHRHHRCRPLLAQPPLPRRVLDRHVATPERRFCATSRLRLCSNVRQQPATGRRMNSSRFGGRSGRTRGKTAPPHPPIVPVGRVASTSWRSRSAGRMRATTCGQGTFAAGPGSNDWPVVGTDDVVQRPHDIPSSFSGTAGQEFVGDTSTCGAAGSPNFAMEDCTGNEVRLALHDDLHLLGRRHDCDQLQRNLGHTNASPRAFRLTPVDYEQRRSVLLPGSG